MARLATPGPLLIEANESRTCSAGMASTVIPPKAGRMSRRTMSALVFRVFGFQRRACRSRNSGANAAIGCPGDLGLLCLTAWSPGCGLTIASMGSSAVQLRQMSPFLAEDVGQLATLMWLARLLRCGGVSGTGERSSVSGPPDATNRVPGSSHLRRGPWSPRPVTRPHPMARAMIAAVRAAASCNATSPCRSGFCLRRGQWQSCTADPTT